MKNAISIVVFLLTAVSGQVGNVLRAQTFGRDSYTMAMNAWEKSEGVSISPEARDLIAASFERQKGQLADFGGDRVWKDTNRTLTQTLVIYYLGELRDHKVDASRMYLTPAQMRRQTSTNERETTTTSRMAEFKVGLSDVNENPVEKFINGIRPVLKGPKGELHVSSKPTGASITLDKSSRGYTEKITVESAGSHRIIVSSKTTSMRCEDSVNIPAGGSVTFHCP